uniref:Uncharacterized protein n=1 Tax=Hucho hucho TaxID=62062 RepID=A0A4W5JUL1_9TELE
MNEICQKDLLARNMNRMLQLFPKEYNIFPKTWCLTAEYIEFQGYCKSVEAKDLYLQTRKWLPGQRESHHPSAPGYQL